MLSKYLYDERIKSKLKKEITFLHEIQKTNNMKYPYERAEKFNSSLRKLSLETNQNYIDQFRVLVTHIGNKIGHNIQLDTKIMFKIFIEDNYYTCIH